MERIYEYIKEKIVNFKFNSYCWLAPVHIGVYIVGYFSLFMSTVFLVSSAAGGIPPLLQKVQEEVYEEDASPAVCSFAYGIELSFNVVFLCAIHRRDIVLLRVYIYYSMISIAVSMTVYAVVFDKISTVTKIAIMFYYLFQIYVIILVRSFIVEIKINRKKLNEEKIQLNRVTVHTQTIAETEVQTETETTETQTETDQALTEQAVTEQAVTVQAVTEQAETNSDVEGHIQRAAGTSNS